MHVPKYKMSLCIVLCSILSYLLLDLIWFFFWPKFWRSPTSNWKRIQFDGDLIKGGGAWARAYLKFPPYRFTSDGSECVTAINLQSCVSNMGRELQEMSKNLWALISRLGIRLFLTSCCCQKYFVLWIGFFLLYYLPFWCYPMVDLNPRLPHCFLRCHVCWCTEKNGLG